VNGSLARFARVYLDAELVDTIGKGCIRVMSFAKEPSEGQSTIRSSVIAATRITPKRLKKWIQNRPALYHMFRKAFSFFVSLDGSTVMIETGPMRGMSLVVSEHVSHAHIRGTYELETQLAVDRLVAPGFTCYDLGASIGYLSLLMARKAKWVFAFEPTAHAAAELRKHATANQLQNITIVPSPVSDVVRTVRFTVNTNAYGSRIAGAQSKWPTVELKTIILDDFVKANPWPDFIKIDVEDEEARVLEGARSILRERKASLCCELHSEESARKVQEILSEYGYTLMDLHGGAFRITTPVIPGDLHVVALPNR
jgi:FkbM family methyltransferase